MADTHDFKKEQTLYYKVFGTLAVLTVVTVAISNLQHGVILGIVLALLVAITKASLVASFFMHLSHEKKLIYVVLVGVVFLFIYMMGFIVFGSFSVPQGTKNLNFEYYSEKTRGQDHHGQAELTVKEAGGHH